MKESPSPAWADRNLDQVLGNLLRGGALLAALVVMVGGSVYLVRHAGEKPGVQQGDEEPSYHIFVGEPEDFRTLSGIVAAALSGSGRGIIQFGILLLIATPIARVVCSLFAFLLQRDYTYVIVTLIVLAVLLHGLLVGALD